MTVKSVLLRPQSLRPRARALTCPPTLLRHCAQKILFIGKHVQTCLATASILPILFIMYEYFKLKLFNANQLCYNFNNFTFKFTTKHQCAI